MRFNFTLIPAFFFASAVLADRSLEHRSSQLNIVEKRTNAASDSGEVIYTNWAGAGLNKSVPTFGAISGTIQVPYVVGPPDSAVGIWVGIDSGFGSCGALFQAGVVCGMTVFGPTCTAVAEWLPKTQNSFTNIHVSPGDLITVSLTVTDQTTGYATMKNFGNGTKPTTDQTLKFSDQPALCQLSAEWIVSKVESYDLANFSAVSFTNPLALGGSQKFTPASGSAIFDIENVTSVYLNEYLVTIKYE